MVVIDLIGSKKLVESKKFVVSDPIGGYKWTPIVLSMRSLKTFSAIRLGVEVRNMYVRYCIYHFIFFKYEVYGDQ